MIDHFLMELTIENKYIAGPKRTGSYTITDNISCPFHHIVHQGNFYSFGFRNLKKSVLQSIIKFLIDYVEGKGALPSFLVSFMELSQYSTEYSGAEPITLVVDIIWLLRACHMWITQNKDGKYDIAEINRLQTKISKSILPSKKGQELCNAIKVLRNKINLFTKDCYQCQCQCTIHFEKNRFSSLGIGNRIDLLQKFVSEDKNTVCINFGTFLRNIANLIKKELRQVEYDIKTKFLNEIPKNMWTDIFVKRYEGEHIPIYVDTDNNMVDIYNPEYDSDGEPTNKIYAYVYQGEEDPKPIYKVSFVNQKFCILCDAYKQPNLLPKIIVDPHCRGFIEYSGENSPYVCTRLCNVLSFYCHKKDFVQGSKFGTICHYDIRNLRYGKNRMMEFYAGCSDNGSTLSLLGIDDIKRYIIWKFLDLLEIGPTHKKLIPEFDSDVYSESCSESCSSSDE
jgi:hypothetical protein